MVNEKTTAGNRSRKSFVLTTAMIVILIATRLSAMEKVYGDANTYDWTRQANQDLSGGNYSGVASSADGSHLIVGAQNGGNSAVANPLDISSDYGATWQNVAAQADPGIQDDWASVAESASGQTLVATSYGGTNISTSNGVGGGIYVSHDGGTTWENDTPTQASSWEYVAVSGDGNKIVALAGDDNSNAYISNNGGTSWTASPVDPVQFWGFASISADGNKVLVGGENQNSSASEVDLSTDGGTTWQDLSPDTGNTIYEISAEISADGSKIAVSSTGFNNNNSQNYDAVQVSSDDGTNWSNITPDSSNSNHYWNSVALSGNGSMMSVLDNDNDVMYESNNGGNSWSLEDPDQADSDADSIDWNSVAISENGSHTIVDTTNDVYDGYQSTSDNNTVTLNNAANGGTVLLTTPSGTNITCNSTVAESSLPVQDSSYTYPLGLLDFCFDNSENDNTVTLTYVTNLTPSEVSLRSYDTATEQYSAVSGATITQTTYNGKAALLVTYTIPDTNLADTNPDFGLISDPVGLAVASTAAPASSTLTAPDTGYGSPSNKDVSIIAPISTVFLAAGMVVAQVRRKINL